MNAALTRFSSVVLNIDNTIVIMTNDIDSRIIHSVSRYPRLYDKSVSSNNAYRREAWMVVAQECKIPMDQCQNRWKTLRDRYVKEINKASPKGFPLFENLNFLRGHIHLKRKRPSNVSDPSTTSYSYYIDEMTQDEAPSSMSMQCPLEEEKEQREEQEYLSDNGDTSSVEFVADETVAVNEKSTNPPDPAPTPAKRATAAMEHLSAFSKVINMLKQALQEKSKPAEAQDPFHEYLESILSRVDESTRTDIQLRLLNFAHEEIKKTMLL